MAGTHEGHVRAKSAGDEVAMSRDATLAFSVTGLTVGTILKTIFENQGLT